MNFRFFVNFSSLFKFPSTTTTTTTITATNNNPKPYLPRNQDSESNPIASLSSSPSFATSNSIDLRLLLTSIWSLIPATTRPRPCPPPSPVVRSHYDPQFSRPLFRPYVAKVPWHGGVRAFLSQLFPRYGHYCGPNWSSGKDGGNLLWDRRPIDWLDFCCYCHDIGYDTHDQAKLLKADLAFLDCLERPRMATKGDAHAAQLYRSMCIAGLRNVLIPYRMQLVRLQGGPSMVELLSNMIGKNIIFRRD